MHLCRGDPQLQADPPDLVGIGDLDRMPGIVDELGELGLAIANVMNVGASILAFSVSIAAYWFCPSRVPMTILGGSK